MPNQPTPPGASPTLPSFSTFTTRGRCSFFGGPRDLGVKPAEGLAIFTRVDQAPGLFLPVQPVGTSGLARRLNPARFYVACRWNYKRQPIAVLRKLPALVRSPATGKTCLVWPADWGPGEQTGRVVDVSPAALDALQVKTDDVLEVTWPAPGYPQPAALA